MIILGIDPGTAITGYGVIKIPDDILGREFDYGMRAGESTWGVS